ncbi:N-acetylglutamate synthase, mitochondrial-like [Anneissia japonica]|uniref:N-acetylglutamate synthase, mitochondrial-like n=1 Tax=Anneissia japonica TaxID=1529436 RepID=UPI001425A932|nr:N-acetylglutamate synthase, mitochondrial-like [Anneissia japonica]
MSQILAKMPQIICKCFKMMPLSPATNNCFIRTYLTICRPHKYLLPGVDVTKERTVLLQPKSRGFIIYWQRWKSDFLQTLPKISQANFGSKINHDLRRFLEEIGTDPKEARYWLKQFQNIEQMPSKIFAVVQVHQDIFQQPKMLEALSSNLSFLFRNDMISLIVHGATFSENVQPTPDELRASRRQVNQETMTMVNFLHASGTPAHPLFSGSNVLKADPASDGSMMGKVVSVNTEPLEWCLGSGHMPVISSVGETSSSQLVSIDVHQATTEIAKAVQPLKVLFLNNHGGITNNRGHVIGEILIPGDLEKLMKEAWYTKAIENKVDTMVTLLEQLPSTSSVVITSATTLLTELFTRHGAGTLFKKTDPILEMTNLNDVNISRLGDLMTRAFGRPLKDEYLRDISSRLNTIYISESYDAAAVITNEGDTNVPYLDKFVISTQSQGEGTSDMLWDVIRAKFNQLFWRSQHSNKINPWYFKRCEGSWSNSKWTVFWYGINDPKLSYTLVDYAVRLKTSFIEANDSSSILPPKMESSSNV